jgi:hypothetical protein
MQKSDIRRIILVLALLSPLVYLQMGAEMAPDWMYNRIGGVPITVLATTGWFILMMGLSILFARKQVASANPEAAEQ